RVRVGYYRAHLLALREAMRQGVDVRGYFAWSLLDNLEWSSGFSLRFGLVAVDFATQQRTIKASGEYYRDVIRTHGESLAAAVPAGWPPPGGGWGPRRSHRVPAPGAGSRRG